MPKVSLFLIILLLFSNIAIASKPVALFSPKQGKQAFNKFYQLIKNARKSVKLTIYSWSEKGLAPALRQAIDNGASVRVVLHNKLVPNGRTDAVIRKREKTLKKILPLEAYGVEFKIAAKLMHEKFLIVDKKQVVNSSANISNGAKSRYNENFIFLDRPKYLIKAFRNEFAILWNSASDIISGTEGIATREQTSANTLPERAKVKFYSSSMNWIAKPSAAGSSFMQKGQYVRLSKKKGSNRKQIWTVKNMLIKSIRNAKHSIYLALNHFNLADVAQELVKASKRGVDVKFAIDNQGYKLRGIEKNFVFVNGWKKIAGNRNKSPPVRVKYYSHIPSPSYWYLNHHKFLLIDYNNNNQNDNSLLITGSYNLSTTAEHKQFDNMVTFKGLKYSGLLQSFFTEFEHLWNFNRNNNDQPKKDIINRFFTLKGDSYPLHIKDGVSLNWDEVTQLRKKISRKAPGIFRVLNNSTRDCYYYNPKRKSLWGGKCRSY